MIDINSRTDLRLASEGSLLVMVGLPKHGRVGRSFRVPLVDVFWRFPVTRNQSIIQCLIFN